MTLIPCPSMSRRSFLHASTALAAAAWFPSLAMAAAAAPKRRRSCILLWMDGGPSTIDLWDLKPGSDNGGPYQPISTNVPGIAISEHLPRLAKQADQLAIIRSMSTREGDHARASFLLRSGYAPQGAIQFPAFGASVAHQIDGGEGTIPPYISISPTYRLGSEVGGGFLGPRFNPLVLGKDETLPVDEALQVPNLSSLPDEQKRRFAKRMQQLEMANRQFLAEHPGGVADSRHLSSVAAAHLAHPSLAKAFDLSQEKRELRDAYGRNLFGQGCLLARRLVQHHVPFIEVALRGWDTHSNNFIEVANHSSVVDIAFSTLLTDLKEQGLLDTTTILWMGEFGRTPKINKTAGRDHWPNSFSAVLAGGGIAGGVVHGATSNDGTTVEENPTSVADLLATVCSAIGIAPDHENISNVTRPIPIVDRGAKSIQSVLQ